MRFLDVFCAWRRYSKLPFSACVRFVLAAAVLMIGLVWFVLDTLSSGQLATGFAWLLTAVSAAWFVLLIGLGWKLSLLAALLGRIVTLANLTALGFHAPAFDLDKTRALVDNFVHYVKAEPFDPVAEDEPPCIADYYLRLQDLTRDAWMAIYLVPEVSFVMRLTNTLPSPSQSKCTTPSTG